MSRGEKVALESVWSYGIGGIVGGFGSIGAKGPLIISFEWWVKLAFTQEFTMPFKMRLDKIRKMCFN